MKIWLDDIRDAPDETWTVVRNPWGFLNLLTYAKPGEVEAISFDHDLACFNKHGEERTGYILGALQDGTACG